MIDHANAKNANNHNAMVSAVVSNANTETFFNHWLTKKIRATGTVNAQCVDQHSAMGIVYNAQ